MRSRQTTRWVAAIGLAIVAVALAVVPAASASAAPTFLEFSADGSTWSPTPPASLFSSSLRLVPGDAIARTVYVRSTRSDPTALSVALADVSVSSRELGSALAIHAVAGSSTPLESSMSALGSCAPLVSALRITRNQAIPITVSLRLATALHTTQAQNASVSFGLQIGLSDVGSTVAPSGCPQSPTTIAGTGGHLAFTGSAPSRIAFTGTDTLYPALVVAGIAFAIGTLFAAVGRRRRRTKGHQEKN
jgi:hypothetical protein